MCAKMRLTESDLKFGVETVATRRRDHDHIIGLVRDKEDLLEPMLEDPKLAERLVREQEMFVRVSPYLMFGVLLRRVRCDLEIQSFVFERDVRGKRIPVFEAPQAAQLLGCVCAEAFPTQKGAREMKHAIIAGAKIAPFYNLGSVVARKEK